MAKLVVEQGHGTQLGPGLIHHGLRGIQCYLSGIINDDFDTWLFDYFTVFFVKIDNRVWPNLQCTENMVLS